MNKKIKFPSFTKSMQILFYVLITLTLFLCLYMMTKFFFFKGTKLELGSLSDWFGTAAMIATAFIAFLAYQSVPDWLTKRTIEKSTDILHEFVDTHLSELQKNLDQLNSHIIYMSIAMTHKQFPNVSDNKEKLSKRVMSLNESTGLVIYTHKRLSRFGFSFSGQIEEIIKFANKELEVHMLVIDCRLKMSNLIEFNGINDEKKTEYEESFNSSLENLRNFIAPGIEAISIVLDKKDVYKHFTKD